jgi:hypothetical protein
VIRFFNFLAHLAKGNVSFCHQTGMVGHWIHITFS